MSGAGVRSSPLVCTSPITPMIVHGSFPGPSTSLIRRPSGSPCGISRRTKASLTSSTCGAVRTSDQAMSRPRTSGMPIVARYPGVAQRISAFGDCPGGKGSPPSSSNPNSLCARGSSGTLVINAALRVPGSASSRRVRSCATAKIRSAG